MCLCSGKNWKIRKHPGRKKELRTENSPEEKHETIFEGYEAVFALYESKMNVLVYPGHPFYEKERLSIEELKEQPLISLNQKYFSYHSFMQRCGDFGFVPNIIINTMESQLIYRFCNEKLGLGIDADIHKTDRLYPDIRRIELQDAIPWKVSMIYRKNEQGRFLVERLAQIM